MIDHATPWFCGSRFASNAWLVHFHRSLGLCISVAFVIAIRSEVYYTFSLPLSYFIFVVLLLLWLVGWAMGIRFFFWNCILYLLVQIVCGVKVFCRLKLFHIYQQWPLKRKFDLTALKVVFVPLLPFACSFLYLPQARDSLLSLALSRFSFALLTACSVSAHSNALECAWIFVHNCFFFAFVFHPSDSDTVTTHTQ